MYLLPFFFALVPSLVTFDWNPQVVLSNLDELQKVFEQDFERSPFIESILSFYLLSFHIFLHTFIYGIFMHMFMLLT